MELSYPGIAFRFFIHLTKSQLRFSFPGLMAQISPPQDPYLVLHILDAHTPHHDDEVLPGQTHIAAGRVRGMSVDLEGLSEDCLECFLEELREDCLRHSCGTFSGFRFLLNPESLLFKGVSDFTYALSYYTGLVFFLQSTYFYPTLSY